jgi:hypothetical protein
MLPTEAYFCPEGPLESRRRPVVHRKRMSQTLWSSYKIVAGGILVLTKTPELRFASWHTLVQACFKWGEPRSYGTM